jgi:hypothetical protein
MVIILPKLKLKYGGNIIERNNMKFSKEELLQECKEIRKKVSLLSNQERAELLAAGLTRIYPEGYSTCEKCSCVHSVNEICPLCNPVNK